MSRNALTPAEIERLAKLAEECGEITQMVGKILIHGYENTHPRFPELGTNRARLEEEIGNLNAIVCIMEQNRDMQGYKIRESEVNKLKTIWKYLHENIEKEV